MIKVDTGHLLWLQHVHTHTHIPNAQVSVCAKQIRCKLSSFQNDSCIRYNLEDFGPIISYGIALLNLVFILSSPVC